MNNRSVAVRINLLLYRLAKHWLVVMLILLGIFVSLPFVAPTLMNAGFFRPANVIYTLYKPFCHQFAFRSHFLYGEQAVYPRANTGTGVTPFEVYITQTTPPEFNGIGNLYAESGMIAEWQDWADLQWASRAFVGNERMGYKVTVCERDISIYLGLFFGGVIYLFTRKRLRPVPIMLYFLLGLGPIGIDGFSQLLSYPPFEFWPVRETLPFFRVLTGATFGLMNAWLGYPYLDLSFKDTQYALEDKFDRAGIDY